MNSSDNNNKVMDIAEKFLIVSTENDRLHEL